ncbi:MAG: cytidylate kinase-like family protein [Oscillospiraceae bacterium]|nr:cytidylate kinase-like family protein [Oscillospiraceae bacterium]
MSILLTISREYGSGGREIAQRLSEFYTDIPVFDRKLIDMTADKCGFSTKFIQENEERMTNSFLFNIAVSGIYSPIYRAGDVEAVPQDYVFLTQSKIITTLAEEHPSAIFVGRCADYILRDNPNLFSVFITADMDFRIKRTVEELGVTPEKAASIVAKHDKSRRRHYNYYTGADWGARANYHMVLNTGKLGIGAATDILKEMISYAQA